MCIYQVGFQGCRVRGGGGVDFQSFGLKAVGLGFGLRIYVSLRTLSRHLRTMKLSVEHASPNPAP